MCWTVEPIVATLSNLRYQHVSYWFHVAFRWWCKCLLMWFKFIRHTSMTVYRIENKFTITQLNYASTYYITNDTRMAKPTKQPFHNSFVKFKYYMHPQKSVKFVLQKVGPRIRGLFRHCPVLGPFFILTAICWSSTKFRSWAYNYIEIKVRRHHSPIGLLPDT